jgi:hypothetical protein
MRKSRKLGKRMKKGSEVGRVEESEGGKRGRERNQRPEVRMGGKVRWEGGKLEERG